jgi:hypothetical protein
MGFLPWVRRLIRRLLVLVPFDGWPVIGRTIVGRWFVYGRLRCGWLRPFGRRLLVLALIVGATGLALGPGLLGMRLCLEWQQQDRQGGENK